MASQKFVFVPFDNRKETAETVSLKSSLHNQSLSFLPFSQPLQQHNLSGFWHTTTGSRSRRASVLVWKTIEAKAAVPKLSGDAQPASGLLMQAVLQRVWLSCLTLLAGRSVSCCISHGSPFLPQEPFYSSQMQGGFQRF